MSYPVNTSVQLSAVLRALRQSRNLSQADVGQLLGVNQKRVARIEHSPGRTSVGQISRLVAALGGRLVIEIPKAEPPAAAKTTKIKPRGKKPAASQGNW